MVSAKHLFQMLPEEGEVSRENPAQEPFEETRTLSTYHTISLGGLPALNGSMVGPRLSSFQDTQSLCDKAHLQAIL